eukprot:CAMPEP_0181098508 /NCGR_PEP_ID=MMETSP1071-20121207/12164_1 /TAXON_ID=35127 /ORGANISM="Thalassiosira sp., Strain NH16" /LENGTH=286 /DNA_ID=CAMNT_0023181109 /DNA_START=244 /DNA_END=1100 /DNA_ORIENTATION=-
MAYTDVCGKKLQSKLGSHLNESASSHTPLLLPSSQSFAKRQLEKMGWTEGTGLGKNRDGMRSHVKIRKREDDLGLGREKEVARELGNVWWKDSVGGTLARLQLRQRRKNIERKDDDDDDDGKGEKRRKEKKRKSKRKTREHVSSTAAAAVVPHRTYTDEELFEATGGARFGMRAQRRAGGKWKRTESGNEDLEDRARSSMEWNGRGSARVVVATRPPADDDNEEEGTRSCTTKKRKLANVVEVVVSPPISDGEAKEEEEKEEGKGERKRRRKLERKESKRLEKQRL